MTQMIKALRATKGQVTSACRRLRVAPKTFYRLKARYPHLDDVLTEERELAIDLSETQLFAAIKRGESWAVLYHLKTQGRSRGYTEKQEIDLTANVKASNKYAPLSGEELKAELISRGLPTSFLKD